MGKVKRPLAVNLIIIYIVILFIFGVYSITLGYGGFIGLGDILLILGLYYGLWKMQREWMHVVIFLLGLTTAIHVLLFSIQGINAIGVTIVVLDILSLYWLGSHRNIFIKPERGVSRAAKIGLIILIAIFILIIFGVIAYYAIFAPVGFLNQPSYENNSFIENKSYIQTVMPPNITLYRMTLIDNETIPLGINQYKPIEINLIESEKVEFQINVIEGGNLNTLLLKQSEYEKLVNSTTQTYISYYPDGKYSGIKNVNISFTTPDNDNYVLMVGNTAFLEGQVKQEGSSTFNVVIYKLES